MNLPMYLSNRLVIIGTSRITECQKFKLVENDSMTRSIMRKKTFLERWFGTGCKWEPSVSEILFINAPAHTVLVNESTQEIHGHSKTLGRLVEVWKRREKIDPRLS